MTSWSPEPFAAFRFTKPRSTINRQVAGIDIGLVRFDGANDFPEAPGRFMYRILLRMLTPVTANAYTDSRGILRVFAQAELVAAR